MAVLEQLESGRRISPAYRCLVGRAPSCHLVLNDADVSREQAVIHFDGTRWKVRDLSSTNGTWVSGERVSDSAYLTAGQVVRFGLRNDWRVVDVGAPRACATHDTTGEVIVASATGLLLPAASVCEAYLSNQDGQWLLERDGEMREVHDQERILLRDGTWMLDLPCGEERISAPTATPALVQTALDFTVSRNEEHVQLAVAHAGQRHVLPHRSHSYLLLMLARTRLEDEANAHGGPEDRGWMETKELATMLRTTSEQINVWIWRARQQFQAIEPALGRELRERRPSLGQLRIGLSTLNVRKT
jgi:hypothetical protein